MHNFEQRHTRLGWSRQLLKLTLLTALILAITTFAAGSSQTAVAQGPLGPAWVFQGPAPQLGGPAQDLANVAEPDEPVSGAVTAIVASSTDPDLVYLGAANGGVWKTTNATDPYPTWTPLTDQLQSQSIGIDALDLDPLDTTDQTLLVGTGRFSGYANSGDDLVGLYYTTDGGATWTVTTDSQLSAARITGVAARGDTLLAASENGLYRSTTGPLGTWTEISGTGILPDARAASIAADPNDTNVLYVTFTGASGGLFRTDDLGANWTNITDNIDVISSDTTAFDVAVYNDGSTNVVTALLNGTKVTTAQVSSAAEISTTVTITTTADHGFKIGQSVTTAGVSVAGYNGTYTIASVPTAGTFTYQAAAGLANATGGTATTSEMANAAFRSVNGGAFTTLDVPFVFDDAYGKFGLVADPANPDLVYVSGGYTLVGNNPFKASTYRLDASQPSGSQLNHLYSPVSTDIVQAMSATQTYAFARATTIFPTTLPFDVIVDGEQMTVTAIVDHDWYLTLTIIRGANGTIATAHDYKALVFPLDSAYGAPHVDINNLAIDANGSLLMGTHGGIFEMPDPASTSSATSAWLSRNGNLGVSEMHDVAYDHVTHTLIGSNQDNAVVFQSATGNLTWSVGPGYSGDGGDVAVADLGDGTSIRYGSTQNIGSFQRHIYDADNNLVSKTYLSTSVITDKQFTTPIAVNEVDPHRLLIGGSANLYESLDMGDTINKIATVGVYKRAIAYGGRRNGVDNPDVFYVVDSAHKLHTRTTANGTVVTKSLPSGLWYVRDIVMNSEDWMNVFATDYDDVFASTDGGDTWTDITGNLLSISSNEIQTIEFVEGPSPYIVVGTRSGVFASNLGSLGSWFKLGTDLPDVLVFELDYDAVDDVLAAATLGRGAWLLPDASTALTPAGVPPVLALSGDATVDEGSTHTYTFTVTDPGDSFTVDSLTVGAGSELVAGSLVTAGGGGSFQVTFPDGPGSASVSLQVLDSTGLLSNTETIAVTVNNVKPSVAILGAPTSGSPGTTVNLSSSVTDPSPTDTAAGFTYYWLVQKYVDGVFVGNYASSDAADFSYTPDVAGKYNVFFKAQDKDGLWSSWAFKAIYAASPDLAMDNFEVTVNEAQTATNSGAFAHKGPAPLTLSASVGTVSVPQVLFADDFEAEPLATSTTTLTQWNVTSGNVSVFGPGGSDPLPGDGRYVDLLASAAARIESKATFNLAPGTYRLYWQYGKSDAGLDYGVRIGLDSISNSIYIPPTVWGQRFAQFTVATATSAKIFFDNTYGAMTGALVDDVQLVWMDPPPVAQPDTALNVLGYWQLGEDDAGATNGLAGNDPTLGQDSTGLNPALDLTPEGSPSYEAVDGSFGSVLAMSFNGSTDGYIRATAVTTATDNFGVEAWVKPTGATGPQFIVYNGVYGNNNGFGLLINGGTYQGTYGRASGRTFDTGVAATADVWAHVALVRDNGVTRLYVNGSQVFEDNTVMPNAAGDAFSVGKRPILLQDYLSGSIDDLRIFTFDPGTFDPQDLGINEMLSGTWSWSLNTDDGSADSQTVNITASSGVSGDTSTMPFPLTVENTAPAATLGNGGAVGEDSSGAISFSNQFDPSTADTTAGFHYAYDFDNDSVFEVGDGSYAGSSVDASATVPAGFLADGPGTRTVRARILDKDGGYTDYTTSITINNVAPTASISGPADALVGQLVGFLLGANDGPADQAAGFTYSIDWGDGSSETVDPVAGTGDTIVRHAYASANNYTVQVTATDKDGATSAAPATTSVQVNALDASNLETLVATAPFVELTVADDAALQNQIAAINAMAAPASPKAVTLILGDGLYSGVTLSPPDNIILNLAGSDTKDADGTQIAGDSGPAVTVTSGEVYLQGQNLATSADAPTVLVTGGYLTLDQDEILETPGFLNAAVEITGGSANLGFDVLMQVEGDGAFVSTYVRSALVPHPEGIDAELTPNTYQVTQYTDEGELIHGTLNAVSLSSTSLTSSATTTTVGESVTFTAVVDVKAIEHGPATGKVRFYEGETLLGEGMVNYVNGQFVAEFTTDVLSVGVHEITAVYSGDEAYVASSSELTHEVIAILADLSVTKSDDADPVNNEDLLTYTIVVTNHGPAVATDVALTDTLPEETELISFTSSLGVCLEEDNEIVCDLGDLA
ncbi:MAG: Ig-like domain repeat protein, partial [Anaerolineales bacterium]|nr:Ig-like domain repeat protein [Anaerolineales bacterium]